MTNNSISLHRVIKASPEKVFRAFSDQHAFASWIPPFGFLCIVHQHDFKVGGSFKMSFRNFTSGKEQSFGGKYLEIKLNERISYSDKFDSPDLPGEMTTTVHFNKVICGISIQILQEGIPSVIPIELCYLGWQESLEKLIRLVEPVIPDA